MIVRTEQIESLASISFENEMVRHFQEFAPRLAEVIGEPSVRHTVKLSVDRATGWGFTNRGPLRFYLESMIALGSDFDTDPQLPWAAAILEDSTIADQMDRADRLYQQMHEYYQKVMGPGNEYGIEALRRMAGTKIEDFAALSGNFEDGTIARFRELYPQKCEYAGEPALRTLIRNGVASAQKYSLPGQAGSTLMAGMMVAFGHGVATDSLYPWIRSTLEDPRIPTPKDRAKRLYDKLMVYLRQVLANVDGIK